MRSCGPCRFRAFAVRSDLAAAQLAEKVSLFVWTAAWALSLMELISPMARHGLQAELQLVAAAQDANRRLPENSQVSELTEGLAQLLAVVACSPQ